MHKHIKGDDNCDFRVVSGLLGKGEENYQFIFLHLIHEMKMHRESYTKIYGNKAKYDVILNDLVPCLNGLAPFDKWMRFPKMGHLIASGYDRVCIALTLYDLSRTFFPLRSKSPQNPFEHMAIKNTIFCSGFF